MADFDTDYSDNEMDVGLDEEAKKLTGGREEWLKMTKGQAMRVAFVNFHGIDVNAVAAARAAAKKAGQVLTADQARAVGRKTLEARAASLGKSLDQLTAIDRLDLTEAKFKSMKAHYSQGVGFVLSRLGKDGPEADAVWRKLEEPKQYFTTLLLVYPTDSKGDMGEAERKRVATDWRLLPWRFGKGQFEKIWKLNAGLRENNLSIANQDLKLECKDTQYQNVETTFVGGAIWQKNPAFRDRVLTAAMAMYDKLVPFREMTTDQLRAKLGLGGPAISDVAAGDFNDMLEGV